ncbi:LppM family (lipo)protein [Actinomyces oris]|uniref:LppM family (lipo)protein n=1 Tax=Actinomyces oris TaxID=544580 RepID=UPI0028E7A045|nr:viral protein TPX [Actinomyces oris]
MPHVFARPISAPRSVLASLFVLTVSAALTLAGAPAHGLPTAPDSSLLFEATIDIVLDEDDTYTLKAVMTDHTGLGALTESDCKGNLFNGGNAKATFKENGDTRTCTIEGNDSIDNSDGQIKHKGDEYIVTTGSSSDTSSSPPSDGVKYSQSVTFPGKVTEADGGKVEGNKVTFDNLDSHKVKGKDKAPKKAAASSKQASTEEEEDSGSTPVWVWVVVGVIAVAIVGGVAAAVVMNQRKKNQPQFNPYAAPAQGYDPNQALFGQPGQPVQQPYQPGQPTPQPYQPVQQPYQPGYGEPATQPYQQGQPTPQPYQPGYAEPAAQPYQPGQPTPQPYQPVQQPYQPGQPTPQPYQQAQPYQQPFNNQPGAGY